MDDLLRSTLPGPHGADEITLRICLYEPLTFQAVIKRRDRTKSWASVTSADPADALRAAMEQAQGWGVRPRVRRRAAQ